MDKYSILNLNDIDNNLLSKARYSENLAEVLVSLSAERILYCKFVADWQGEVDIDVLLRDGRVFSYYYNYGSCSGCDEWEAKDYSDSEINQIMEKEATFFDDIQQYSDWEKVAGIRKKVQEIRGEVTLGDLVGAHTLRAVEYDSNDDASEIHFQLDEMKYCAAEDPDDGYRSYMGSLKKTDRVFKNVFENDILCRMKGKDSEGEEIEILEFLDLETGKLVMEVGTDMSDSYYPSFIDNSTAANMSCNKNVSKD